MRLPNGSELSGSKAHRFWRCPASAVLPQDTDADREAEHEPARGRGKQVHAFLERVKLVGRDQALAELPHASDSDERVYMLCSALQLDKMPAHLATEVAYALNWCTGVVRELGRNLGHRNYDLLPEPPSEDEIAFTLDAVGMAVINQTDGSAIRRGYVGDYKVGHTRYPRPAEYGQTLLGALGIMRLYDLDEVVVELIYIDEDGEHYAVRDRMDRWDVDTFERELVQRLELLDTFVEDYRAGRGLPLNQGSHCDHCLSYKHCDAKTALVRAMPAELLRLGVRQNDKLELELTPGAITASNAAVMYQAAEAIEAIAKRMKGEVCELGWHAPIELHDGRVIEPRESRRRVVDGRIAATVLQELWGPEEVAKRVTIKCSIEALKDAAVAHKGPKEKIETQKKDGALDKLMARIERLGGVGESVSKDCKPYTPRKRKALK